MYNGQPVKGWPAWWVGHGGWDDEVLVVPTGQSWEEPSSACASWAIPIAQLTPTEASSISVSRPQTELVLFGRTMLRSYALLFCRKCAYRQPGTAPSTVGPDVTHIQVT
ncbi:hypothetical protein ACFQ7I_32445 [Streptomyces massasporeus]